MGQDDRIGTAGGVVGFGEEPAQHRLRPHHRQDLGGHPHRVDLLGFGRSGDAHGSVPPDAHLLERPALLAVDEVHRWGGVHLLQVDPRRGQPYANQPVGFRIGQRFEQHALDDGENGAVGADADGEGHKRQRGEHGGAEQPAKDLSHITFLEQNTWGEGAVFRGKGESSGFRGQKVIVFSDGDRRTASRVCFIYPALSRCTCLMGWYFRVWRCVPGSLWLWGTILRAV